MSNPDPGSPKVDRNARKILDVLEKMDEKFFKNLSADILGSMVAEFGRVGGLANQHYGVKIKQAIGGVQGSLHNHIKNGIHTSNPNFKIDVV